MQETTDYLVKLVIPCQNTLTIRNSVSGEVMGKLNDNYRKATMNHEDALIAMKRTMDANDANRHNEDEYDWTIESAIEIIGMGQTRRDYGDEAQNRTDSAYSFIADTLRKYRDNGEVQELHALAVNLLDEYQDSAEQAEYWHLCH